MLRVPKVVVIVVVATAHHCGCNNNHRIQAIKLIIDLWRKKKNFFNIFMCNTTNRNQKVPCRKCRCIVDIAYKRAFLYVWFPEVKSMFAQIIIECQTKKETVSCEYCIMKQSCYLRIDLENKIRTMNEPLELMVPIIDKSLTNYQKWFL